MLVGGLLVACTAKRSPDLLPEAAAQPGDAGGQVPPEIKKGVRVEFFVVGSHPTGGELGLWYDTLPVIEEIKGAWVLVRCKPNEKAVKDGFKDRVYWVNFNNVVYYAVK